MRPLFRLQQTARTRAGFTLLEVLLTTLLASVVLVALWSLSDIYLKMFASGKRKIEETQLVRSLTAQLAKDVSQVIQLPEESVAATSVPFLRFPAEARPAAPPGSAAAISGPRSPSISSYTREGELTPPSLRTGAALPCGLGIAYAK